MKTLTAIIFAITLFLSSSKLTLTSDTIVLSLDKTATDSQLADFKNQLVKRKIYLSVEKLERSSDSNIKFIRIKVDCHDGFKGSIRKRFY